MEPKQEELEKLKNELRELHAQARQQQHRIEEIWHRLKMLQGNDSIAEPKPYITEPEWTPENFIGLRLIHLVGIVVLVIGLSIGVKYAMDRNLVSENMRIILAYMAGGLLYFFSWKLRSKYFVFSAILLSGAMASLYFTTYAAYVYYGMMPFAVAFILMAALTVFTTYKAIEYNRQEIALLGLVGAYAIPFLISQNTENVALFFLYILLINSAVVFLSFRKEWVNVARVAQFLTWIFFLAWAGFRREAGDAGTGYIFAGLFYLVFTASVFLRPVLNSVRMTPSSVIQKLLNEFALYIALLLIAKPDDQGVATITGCYAMFMGIQTVFFYQLMKAEKFLAISHLVLTILLSVMFVAAQWDGFTVTLLWLLMGITWFIAGVRIRSVALRLASIGLMGLTLLKLLIHDSQRFTPEQKVISYISLGVLLLVISFLYQKFRKKIFERDEVPERSA